MLGSQIGSRAADEAVVQLLEEEVDHRVAHLVPSNFLEIRGRPRGAEEGVSGEEDQVLRPAHMQPQSSASRLIHPRSAYDAGLGKARDSSAPVLGACHVHVVGMCEAPSTSASPTALLPFEGSHSKHSHQA